MITGKSNNIMNFTVITRLNRDKNREYKLYFILEKVIV